TVEAEPNFGSNFQKLPFILSYDPSSDLVVTFELPGGSRLDLATIFIPAGATNERATLTVSYPLDLSNYLDGDLDLSILLQSQTTGQLIESLLEALELRTWTSTGTPRLQELNGSILELTNLSEPRLSLDIDAGIFRFTDDSIQVISKKLSRFTNLNLDLISSQGVKKRAVISTRKPAERNRLLYGEFASKPFVLVDLKSTFGNQLVQLQLHKYVRGGNTYLNLAELKLDEFGNASHELNEPLRKRDRIRVLIDGTKVIYHSVVLR
ncbi:MAG: hypothetical protein RL159_191, partial [Actinomycetota bacterium]